MRFDSSLVTKCGITSGKVIAGTVEVRSHNETVQRVNQHYLWLWIKIAVKITVFLVAHSIAEANSLICEDHILVTRLLILTCE